jgi:hypothetical protein
MGFLSSFTYVGISYYLLFFLKSVKNFETSPHAAGSPRPPPHHSFILREATSSVCTSLKIIFLYLTVEFNINIASFRSVRSRATKHKPTMASDGSPRPTGRTMIEPLANMAHTSFYHACAEATLFKRPNRTYFGRDKWWESGWKLGWFLSCRASTRN